MVSRSRRCRGCGSFRDRNCALEMVARRALTAHRSDGFSPASQGGISAGRFSCLWRIFVAYWTPSCSLWYSIGVSNEAARSKADVLPGTLDLMVLQPLDWLGALHGYAIAAPRPRARRRAAARYWHALSGADAAGAARSGPRELGTTETNRKARFYALTPAGRRQLAKEKQAWDRMVGIIHTLAHGGA